MNYLNHFLLLCFIAVCCSCNTPKPNNSEPEKYQNKRNNIVNVKDKLKVIMKDEIIDNGALLYIMEDYLIVEDHQSQDKFIQIFNKNDFSYITSTGTKGEGPGEISRIGGIKVNEDKRKFVVSDFGKHVMFEFDLDSVLTNPSYLPVELMKVKHMPMKFEYINDTTSIGLFMEVIGSNDFMPVMAVWNMKTDEIIPMKYQKHPDIEKKRVMAGISIKDSIYVECSTRHNLMTICDLQGNLKNSVYGPDWKIDEPVQHFFGGVTFARKYILVGYDGTDWYAYNQASKILIFDLAGNYIKTLETGCQFFHFCYDEDNNRLIFSTNGEYQFAYLDMAGLWD